MNFNLKLIIAIGIIGMFSCNTSKFFIPEKAVLTPEGQYDNCKGYKLFVGHNEYGECVYEEYKCLGGGRGTYCAYSQCDKSRDTLLFIEFKANDNYKYVEPWKLTKYEKEHYRHIADGLFIMKEGFRSRGLYTHPNHVYLKENPIIYEEDLFAEKQYTQWGDFAYWAHGRQKGMFKDGVRQGKWIIEGYTIDLEAKTLVSIPEFRRETSNFKDGLKDGVTTYFFTTNTTLKEPSQWNDTIKVIPYKDGKIDGWMKKWDTESGRFIDSVRYENGKVIK